MDKKIVIIDYGAGNTQSLKFALQKLGYEATLSNDAGVIQTADYVFFPGVGHAEQALKQLERFGLKSVIQNLKQPFLGICLGMQMMGSYLEEGKVQGLNIVEGDVMRFNQVMKVPHMGWNQVNFNPNHPLFKGIEQGAYFYFVHSFKMNKGVDTVAWCDYGDLFTAVLEQNNFFGCQFHPEKSGALGLQFLDNFLNLKL